MAGSLQVKAVRKSYGKKVILKDVDFQVQQGEFVVLVGPSGCGKSTMLRCIAGLEVADTGSIDIAGRDVTNLAPKDRNIAMVFQDYALYPHKNVYENIAFGLRIKKLKQAEIDERVKVAAKKLNLMEYLDRRPAALSGGQRQRVAIGRAIVRQPEVFLFDEPLSNLDAKLRGSMRVSIAKLHKELGATIVYVTHDQVEAMTLADKIIVLNEGVIQQMGDPLRLYYYPSNIFVATFIGSPPMNLINGTLAGTGENLHFVSENGLEFQIPKSLKALLDPSMRAGQEVVWGIRPENLVIGEKHAHVDFSCEGEVVVVESLGASSIVICNIAGHELELSIPEPHRPLRGQKLKFHWWAEHIYLFDKKSGKSLVNDVKKHEYQ